MMTEFNINKDYAKRYLDSRRKEELQKYKEKYGNVKASKEKTKMEKKERIRLQNDSDAESDMGESNSDSSSSDSSTDEESIDREHEDFLSLYEALCNQDPSLNDPDKEWFHSPDSAGEEVITDSTVVNEQTTVKKERKEKTKKASLSLKDYERKFMLEQGGVEDEQMADDAKAVAEIESDELLNKLPSSEVTRKAFLEASKVAFDADDDSIGNTQDSMNFLQRRQTVKSGEKTSTKSKINADNLVFTEKPNTEAEAFLHDFIVNQRWKRRKEDKIPSYSEVLRHANVKDTVETNAEEDEASSSRFVSDFSGPPDEEAFLDQDDDFLIRVREFERGKQRNPLGPVSLEKPIAEHRFEEEDKDFIKSYPRKLTNSIQQGTEEGITSRSVKRQAREKRKAEAKRIKLADMERMRLLQLSAVADKIERIKRSSGVGCSDLATFNATDVANRLGRVDETDEGAVVVSSEAAQALAAHLDDDWDPEKHSELLDRIFNEEYYDVEEDLPRPPAFSDVSNSDCESPSEDGVEGERKRKKKKKKKDSGVKKHPVEIATSSLLEDQAAESDNENEPSEAEDEVHDDDPSARRRHRVRSKNRLKRALKRDKPLYDPTVDGDFETYFNRYYKLPCEDILPGPTKDEDVFCRFRYREVPANDFGLNTEDVLKATTRELNAWIPITRVTGYRTDQEEERDQRMFHSNKRMEKKLQVIASLSDPNVHWWPSDGTQQTESQSTKKKRKRSRKKKTNDILDTPSDAVEPNQEAEKIESKVTKRVSGKKSSREGYKKFTGIQISDARLAASGITIKDVHRAKAKQSKRRKIDTDNV